MKKLNLIGLLILLFLIPFSYSIVLDEQSSIIIGDEQSQFIFYGDEQLWSEPFISTTIEDTQGGGGGGGQGGGHETVLSEAECLSSPKNSTVFLFKGKEATGKILINNSCEANITSTAACYGAICGYMVWPEEINISAMDSTEYTYNVLIPIESLINDSVAGTILGNGWGAYVTAHVVKRHRELIRSYFQEKYLSLWGNIKEAYFKSWNLYGNLPLFAKIAVPLVIIGLIAIPSVIVYGKRKEEKNEN